MYQYTAQLLDVVDGDTMHVEIDLGLDIKQRVTLRLAGVNAAEHGTTAGDAATAWAKTWFDQNSHGGRVVINTQKDRREKYGRYLARILSWDMARCLNDELVQTQHAVPYDGGKR